MTSSWPGTDRTRVCGPSAPQSRSWSACEAGQRPGLFGDVDIPPHLPGEPFLLPDLDDIARIGLRRGRLVGGTRGDIPFRRLVRALPQDVQIQHVHAAAHRAELLEDVAHANTDAVAPQDHAATRPEHGSVGGEAAGEEIRV